MLGMFREDCIYGDVVKKEKHYGKILIVNCVWKFEMNQVYAKLGLECLEKSNFEKSITDEFKKLLKAILILDAKKISDVEIEGITNFGIFERIRTYELENSLKQVKSLKEELDKIYIDLDKIKNGAEDLVLSDVSSDKLQLKEFILNSDNYEVHEEDELELLSKDKFHLVDNGEMIYFDKKMLESYRMCHVIVPEKTTGDYYFDLFLEIIEFINAKRSINGKDIYNAISEEGMILEIAQYVNRIGNKISYFRNCSSVRNRELFIFDLIAIENTLSELETYIAIGNNIMDRCIESLNKEINNRNSEER